MQPGPRNAITDVAGLIVGQASDPTLKSGVTVLTGAAPFTAAVHVMGGAPGTTETDALSPDRLVQQVDALVLSGGSAFGLGACDGVRVALRAAGRGFAIGTARVPIVAGAILFDLLAGGDHSWTDPPWPALGAAALRGADADVALGSVGAGTGATAGGLKGGIGTASLAFDGLTVGALVAVNPVGGTVAGPGGQFWAAPFEIGDEFGGLGPAPPGPLPPLPDLPRAPGSATTIAIVATDAQLDQAQATRVAVAAHDGLARAIVPSHTLLDGDCVFAAATGRVPLADPVEGVFRIGHAAALCLSRAIARGVYAASAAPGDTVPTWRARYGRD